MTPEPYRGTKNEPYNIIYVAKGPDDYLYLKSSNPQFLYLKNLSIDAIFQNPKDIIELCNCNCDLLDSYFPIEESLVHILISNIVAELSGVKYQPTDKVNNAKNDMENVATTNNKKDE